MLHMSYGIIWWLIKTSITKFFNRVVARFTFLKIFKYQLQRTSIPKSKQFTKKLLQSKLSSWPFLQSIWKRNFKKEAIDLEILHSACKYEALEINLDPKVKIFSCSLQLFNNQTSSSSNFYWLCNFIISLHKGTFFIWNITLTSLGDQC